MKIETTMLDYPHRGGEGLGTLRRAQFSDYWYYIVPLAGGFGVQVALYVKLRLRAPLRLQR
jgi:hypothetical protein